MFRSDRLLRKLVTLALLTAKPYLAAGEAIKCFPAQTQQDFLYLATPFNVRDRFYIKCPKNVNLNCSR
jgi:hypothetical protein